MVSAFFVFTFPDIAVIKQSESLVIDFRNNRQLFRFITDGIENKEFDKNTLLYTDISLDEFVYLLSFSSADAVT